MNGPYRDATLAGHRGVGFLRPSAQDGAEVLEGRWRSDGEGDADVNADLRERYMAREVLTYVDEHGAEAEVFIVGWFGAGHPNSLILRSANALE